MARRDYKALLEGFLTGFLTEQDPVKAMPLWLFMEVMKIEFEAGVGTTRGKHSRERKTWFLGFTTLSFHHTIRCSGRKFAFPNSCGRDSF